MTTQLYDVGLPGEQMSWSDTFLALLKDNEVRLIAYVPDNALTPLVTGITADNYFLLVGARTRPSAP
jgi:hypothetical protein